MDLVDLDAMAEAHPALADLDAASIERLKLMINGAQEVVGLDHLISVLAGGPTMAGDDVIAAMSDSNPRARRTSVGRSCSSSSATCSTPKPT